MANINTNGLATGVCEEAIKTYDLLADKLPNVRDFDKNPERLLNLQGENADIIGALFKNSIGEAEYICRNGRAIAQCAKEIDRINRCAGLALLAGGAALCLGGYIYMKMNKQETEIADLKHRVATLENAKW